MSSDLMDTTVTVYNSYMVGGLPPFGNITKWERAVLKGVHWEETIDRNPDSQGRAHINQSVLILIPKDVDKGGKTYINPEEYARVPNDIEGYWTLTFGTSEPTFIMLGEGRELNDLYPIASLMRDHRVVKVEGVSDTLDSPVLPHLEVRCV